MHWLFSSPAGSIQVDDGIFRSRQIRKLLCTEGRLSVDIQNRCYETGVAFLSADIFCVFKKLTFCVCITHAVHREVPGSLPGQYV